MALGADDPALPPMGEEASPTNQGGEGFVWPGMTKHYNYMFCVFLKMQNLCASYGCSFVWTSANQTDSSRPKMHRCSPTKTAFSVGLPCIENHLRTLLVNNALLSNSSLTSFTVVLRVLRDQFPQPQFFPSRPIPIAISCNTDGKM